MRSTGESLPYQLSASQRGTLWANPTCLLYMTALAIASVDAPLYKVCRPSNTIFSLA